MQQLNGFPNTKNGDLTALTPNHCDAVGGGWGTENDHTREEKGSW